MRNLSAVSPETARDRRHPAHLPLAAALLNQPAPRSHIVQFYEDEAFLFDTVARYLTAGLARGDHLIVIATEQHRDEFLARLGVEEVAAARTAGRLLMLDARATLARFMVDDMPDPERFHALLADCLPAGRELGKVRVRAFGEMVDLLWRAGNQRAAIRLEELWNEASERHEFELLCAYVIANFYREGDVARLLEVCGCHSHVLPAESLAALEGPGQQVSELVALEQRARSLERELEQRRQLEAALREALRERARAERELREAMQRERAARAQAEASEQFKEVFLGMLGHDLRNPLNTILTTTRLMLRRRELSPDSHKRLERVVTSGLRMQRMIEQLLDLARARLAGGIRVARVAEHDLLALVEKIVDEFRVTHPARQIEVHSAAPCRAFVDADRLEQVIANFLGNALQHGDGERPIAVSVAERGELASLRVHNFGTPIDPALIPLLFDPFRRGHEPQRRGDGLGLGLYISERIVSAHGGKIEVDSSEETGTWFEATFPRNV